MLNPESMSDAQLIEAIQRMKPTEGWRCLETLINRKIEKTRGLLEDVQDKDKLVSLQSKIKTLRGILTFDIK